MQAIVKMPHMLENGEPVEFTIAGNVPFFYMDLTRRLFPSIKEVADEGEEVIRIRDSEWFKEMEAKTTPGMSLRAMRTMRNMRQTSLAKKIGIKPQQVSDMENGRSPIGKKMAVKIGEALNLDYKLFLE